MGSSLGRMFVVTTWGESHGEAVGVVVDGCPPLLELCAADLQAELVQRPGGNTQTRPKSDDR